jgi:membrane-associated phospholipid phosphatase
VSSLCAGADASVGDPYRRRASQWRPCDTIVEERQMKRLNWEPLRVLLIVLCIAAPLRAQTAIDAPGDAVASFGIAPFDVVGAFQQPAGPPPTPRHTGVRALFKDLVNDVAHLPSRENLMWVAIGSGLALAVHPADDNVNRYLVGNKTAERIFKPGGVIGELGSLLGGAVTVYAVGRIGDQPKVSHVGMDLIQSLAVSEALTQTLKYTTRRERPDQSSRNSFPSGHAADTFAFATALERHLGWRYATPAYVFASYVGISRMPANRHWLSDAVFGAAVGIIAGRTVTGNESVKYPVAVSLIPGGAAVTFVRRQ